MRRAITLVLLLLFSTPAWAEYCAVQGGKQPVPRSLAERYDRELLLTPQEIIQSEKTHLRWGKPNCGRYLYHREFVVCYDVERRVPSWVSYRLTTDDVVKRARRNAFRTDPRLLPDESASCGDYQGSGFDRGHSVPSADMNRRAASQANTYLLSNMTPQHGPLNQGVWSRLEEMVRAWARASGTIHVLSGSVFDRDEDGRPDSVADTKWSKATRRVGIPSHYYKIVIRERASQDVEAIAVMLPNVKSGLKKTDAFIAQHVVNVRAINGAAGVDLLPDMPALTKERLERAVASELWPRN
jgi:endonuclease G